jgi:hypothetical protein
VLVGLTFALIGAVGGGIFSGLIGGDIPIRTRANEGIRRSVSSALVSALVVGPGFGLIFGLALGLLTSLWSGLLLGMLFGVAGGLGAGLVYGGFAAFQHLVLRLVLWRSGAIPWNYARLLDHCAERIFLRKVGGGYIFVHRLLMEHFASLHERPPSEQTG